VSTLESYKGAIENMVKALYETETIEGAKVRQIIKDYEIANNMPTRLCEEESENSDIEQAKKDAKEDSAE
ncbi:hypothetical protein, partial [Campylobacter sp.]